MTDDLLSLLGRQQQRDLEGPDEPGAEDDPLARPLDDDEQASILDAVFERVDAGSSEPAAASSSSGKVVSLAPRARARRALLGSLVGLAAAAAVILWVLPRDEDEQLTRLPDYAFTKLGGGVADQRSDVGPDLGAALPEVKLRSDSAIDWILTPSRPSHAPVAVALLARADAGETRFVPRLAAEVSQQGAVRLRGRLDEFVALTPGTWTVELLLAAPDRLPADASAASRDKSPWSRLALRVIIVDGS